MRVLIKPQPLSGTVTAIPAKADVHRKLICAALADKPTRLTPLTHNDDVEATIGCLRQLGAKIEADDAGFTVTPLQKANPKPKMECRESGSTLRFLLPLATMLTKEASFGGEGRLPNRPLAELLHALQEHGAHVSEGRLPFTISGGLVGGQYFVPGHISSQYISGLLLALPLAKEDSRITLTTRLEARGYVKMTIHTMRQFGVNITEDDEGFTISGRQTYKSPGELAFEGDWSNAAFFLAAGALRGPVCIRGLSMNSLQGDKSIVQLLESFGAQVQMAEDNITVQRGALNGLDINISDTPDLAPVLAILGALGKGRTRLTNAAQLRLKESDRLTSLAILLSSLGVRVTEGSDFLSIEGQPLLRGGTVRGHSDHRIVMAAALAACFCQNDVIINGAEAVKKSYPDFFRDYNSLGGGTHDVYLG